MENTARLFNCARCHCQVVICSHCDRGNIYCGRRCAEHARKTSSRSAGKRYQRTYRGRIKHAERQRRYRALQNIVTHQGSASSPPNDSLPPHPEAPATVAAVMDEGIRCHFCNRLCNDFLRLDYLHRRPHSSASDRKITQWLPWVQAQAP